MLRGEIILGKRIISKKMLISVILIVVIAISIPCTVYGYNNYKYNKIYDKGMDLLSKENFDEAINTFNSSLKFKPKKKELVESKISLVKELKDSKSVFDSAIQLVNEKKYLEAMDKFKTIKEKDTKRYSTAQDKIKEAGNLYITDNINGAKAEGGNKNYDKAITYLDTILKFDQSNKDAIDLKDSYNKEIQKIKDEEAKKKSEEEAKQKAEEEAKKKAEQKALEEAKKKSEETKKKDEKAPPILIKPPIPFQESQTTGGPVTQAHGRDAIKKEFEKIGFVFNSDTTAMYDKDGIRVGLLDRGNSWQVNTEVWGSSVQDIYEKCITVIWGGDTAWSNLIYIDYALESPGSTFKTGSIQAFVQDGILVMYIFPSN